MANISKSYDRVSKPKLATKADVLILSSKDSVRKSKQQMADRYLQVKQLKEQEEQQKYPNYAYIRKCEEILNNLSGAYQAVYGNQR